MAGSHELEKSALRLELALARARLSESAHELRASMDVGARAKDSFARHRPAWLGGAAIFGLLLAKLPSRKKTVFVERTTGKTIKPAGKMGLVWSAAKLALNLAQPALIELATKRFGHLAKGFGVEKSDE